MHQLRGSPPNPCPYTMCVCACVHHVAMYCNMHFLRRRTLHASRYIKHQTIDFIFQLTIPTISTFVAFNLLQLQCTIHYSLHMSWFVFLPTLANARQIDIPIATLICVRTLNQIPSFSLVSTPIGIRLCALTFGDFTNPGYFAFSPIAFSHSKNFQFPISSFGKNNRKKGRKKERTEKDPFFGKTEKTVDREIKN